MKIHIDHHYDADVEAVYDLISDPDFIERKYVALGGRDVAVDRTDADGGVVEVVTKRTVTVDLPGFAKKVLTPSQTTIQRESWEPATSAGERICTFSLDVQGAPSRIQGTHTLSPAADGGADHRIEVEAKVSIPLIGGKLEKFGADTARADLAEQFAFTDAELAG
jgi:uncharacterized protein YndB with AHSA1/START domain